MRRKGNIVVSVTSFSELVKKDFCPRCFWLSQKYGIPKTGTELPTVPNQIEFIKNYVRKYFDEFGELPEWLEIPNMKGFEKVENLRKNFQAKVKGTDVILKGSPDDIILTGKKSCVILEYKTAMRDEVRKHMRAFSLQANSHAYILSKMGISPHGIFLIFFETPQKFFWESVKMLVPYDDESEEEELILPNLRVVWDTRRDNSKGILIFIADAEENLHMIFRPNVVELKFNAGVVERFAKIYEKLITSETPPTSRRGCENCKNLKKIIEELGSVL